MNPNTLFTSPTDTPIYVASTNGMAAWVGPEPRELPIELHLYARQAGCNAGFVAPPPKSTADAERAPKILAALKEMLVRQNSGDFTQAGHPNLTVVNTIVGEPCPREQVYELFAQLKAEVAADAPPQ